MPRIPSRPPLDLSAKWVVAELPSMADDYLGLTPAHRVRGRGVDSCSGDLLHVRRHAGYNAKDDTFVGTMLYHLGDDLPFVWRRVKARKESPTTIIRKEKA